MGIAERTRKAFVNGLLLIAPLAVTVFVLQFLAGWLFRVVDPVVRETRLPQYTANIEVVAQIIAVVLVVAAITAIGYLAEWGASRRVFGGAGRMVAVVPLVNTIYSNVRSVANALSANDSRYDRAVLVEYPTEETYAIGLVTARSAAEVESATGTETYNVYLPGSPNPTGGRLAILPADRIHEIDMSVRRAIRTLVTTGVGDEGDLPEPGSTIDGHDVDGMLPNPSPEERE